MTLGTCTKCEKAPATHEDDVISTNRLCDPCWQQYLAGFETLNKRTEPKRSPFDEHPRRRELAEAPKPTPGGDFFDAFVGEISALDPEITGGAFVDAMADVRDRMLKGRDRTAATTSARAHYFDLLTASPLDIQLKMAIGQGYVPATCLIGGSVAMSEVTAGRDPCSGCDGPRDRCRGRPKRSAEPA